MHGWILKLAILLTCVLVGLGTAGCSNRSFESAASYGITSRSSQVVFVKIFAADEICGVGDPALSPGWRRLAPGGFAKLDSPLTEADELPCLFFASEDDTFFHSVTPNGARMAIEIHERNGKLDFTAIHGIN